MQVVVRSISIGVVPESFVKKSFYLTHNKSIIDSFYLPDWTGARLSLERVCHSTQVLIPLSSPNEWALLPAAYLFERELRLAGLPIWGLTTKCIEPGFQLAYYKMGFMRSEAGKR